MAGLRVMVAEVAEEVDDSETHSGVEATGAGEAERKEGIKDEVLSLNFWVVGGATTGEGRISGEEDWGWIEFHLGPA